MAAEAIAGALDVDDDGMVKQAVQQRGGDHGAAKDLAPFGKAAVRGQNHGAALVAGIDQLKEQVAAAGDDRQVADLVDDQQLGPAQEAQPLAQCALALGLGERADEVGQGGEVDASGRPSPPRRRGPGPGGSCRSRAGRGSGPTSWRSTKSSWARARMRSRSSEGWKEKSNPAQRLDVEQPAHLQRRLDPAALAQAQLLAEQGVDRLQGGDLAALELAQRCARAPRSARGILRPTRWRRMRSSVAGLALYRGSRSLGPLLAASRRPMAS